MNWNFKYTRMFACTLGAGLLGFCLRWLLYRVGFDEKGILSATHPLQLACLALTVLTAIFLALETRKADGSFQPPALPRFVLGVLAGGLICLHGLSLDGLGAGALAAARLILCFFSATAMVLSVFPSLSGTRLETLCHGVICVSFALEMLCRYQDWSGNPQLPDYCFHVLACVFLALGAYHRLAFGVGLGKRQTLLFCALMGACLSLICAAGPETRIFYLGGALWAGACVFAPEPPAKAPEEEIPDASA